MTDFVCKHGLSIRYCFPCFTAHLIAQLKGPRDMGMLAIKPEHIPEPVWQTAMSTYHKVIRKNPGMAWKEALSAAISAWPGRYPLQVHPQQTPRIILPLTEHDKC